MQQDIHGNPIEAKCIACAINDGSLEAPGGTVAESSHFRLEQDIEVPIPGFLVLASRRHFYAFDEMTADERADYVDFLAKARGALRQLGVAQAYFVLEEDTENSHFHLWIVPKYDWMAQFGKKVASVRPAMEYAKRELKTEENLERVHAMVEEVRTLLAV